MPSPGGPETTTRPSCFAAARVRSHCARQSALAAALGAGEAWAAGGGASLRGAAAGELPPAGAGGAAQAVRSASARRVAVRARTLAPNSADAERLDGAGPLLEGEAFGQRAQLPRPDFAEHDDRDVRAAQPLLRAIDDR